MLTYNLGTWLQTSAEKNSILRRQIKWKCVIMRRW